MPQRITKEGNIEVYCPDLIPAGTVGNGCRRPRDPDDPQPVSTQIGRVRRNALKLFDSLADRPDTELVLRFKTAFERGVEIWGKAGLFTREREAKGFAEPDFEKHYRSFLTKDIVSMMEKGPNVDQGYLFPVWSPVDVPVFDEDPARLTYVKLLKDALLEAFHNRPNNKAPDTLLAGPSRYLLTRPLIDENNILYVDDEVKQAYSCASFDDPSDQSTGVEKKTGGVLRLEREEPIKPRDFIADKLRPSYFEEVFKSGILPQRASPQTLRQAIAFVIYCLKTRGLVPDFFYNFDAGNSVMVFAPATYIPRGAQDSSRAVCYWCISLKQFRIYCYGASEEIPNLSARLGIKIRWN